MILQELLQQVEAILARPKTGFAHLGVDINLFASRAQSSIAAKVKAPFVPFLLQSLKYVIITMMLLSSWMVLLHLLEAANLRMSIKEGSCFFPSTILKNGLLLEMQDIWFTDIIGSPNRIPNMSPTQIYTFAVGGPPCLPPKADTKRR